jgi:excisionase family DNA binding protein
VQPQPSAAPKPRKLIDIDELSSLWAIPKTTLYNWVNQRRLPYLKLGRCVRFDLAEIDAYRDRARMGTAAER